MHTVWSVESNVVRHPCRKCRHRWRQSLRESRVAAIGYAPLKDGGRVRISPHHVPCATAVTHEKIAVGGHTATFELSLHHVGFPPVPLMYVHIGDGKTRRPHGLFTGRFRVRSISSEDLAARWTSVVFQRRGWHRFQKIDSDREMPQEMGGLGMEGLFLM